MNYHDIIIAAWLGIIALVGELTVHDLPDILGEVIKTAREKAGVTTEKLAEQVDVSERYLYKIENEGQKPNYEVLCKLIRELSISSDLIFYPEKQACNPEFESLVRLLCNCDERSLAVVKATAKALIDTEQER